MLRIYLNNLSDKNIATEAQIYTELGFNFCMCVFSGSMAKKFVNHQPLFNKPDWSGKPRLFLPGLQQKAGPEAAMKY